MVERADELDEFDEYVEERPESGRGQRLLVIILSVGCLALAVSNVVLAMRVTQLRRALVAERPVTTDRTAAVPAPAAEGPDVAATDRPISAPAPTVESKSPQPSADERRATPGPAPAKPPARPADTPAPAASIAASPSAPEPQSARPSVEPGAPASPPSQVDLPPRTRLGEQGRVAAVTRTTERPTSVPSSPERSTATWMVQAYGRPDAEGRARAAAEFYGQSPDGAYWRRVLAEITGR